MPLIGAEGLPEDPASTLPPPRPGQIVASDTYCHEDNTDELLPPLVPRIVHPIDPSILGP